MESTGGSEAEAQAKWVEVQDLLKQRLITVDDFTWKLPRQGAEAAADGAEEEGEVLKYVGGVDMSYCKDDPSLACGAVVVLNLPTLEVVHEEYTLARPRVPYIPGFLAFREAPVLLELFGKVKENAPHFYPQILVHAQLIMVDGNGILHPRGFGLACHLGVLANCPTIGVGKNLHHVDGLTLSSVKQLLGAKQDLTNLVTLMGSSGIIWGAGLRSSPISVKPMFISTGHRISLDTAVAIVQMTCKYRVPEPVRQADIRSREYLRKHQIKC
ncbi:endonuclease V isoform X2 [Punica granatum]|uniref:Endonuclease V isoform X2 n=1 Tax=Punica granatum TaxID=22663 RepID=A0A6P8CJT5_PUNGR|nr:endonuclease V isoform X2 [Punica granatum]